MLILDEYYPTWMLDAKATLLSIYIHRDIAKSDIQVPVQLGWCLNTVNKYLRILNLSQYKVSSSGKGPWRVQIVNSSVYLPIISNLIAACRSLAAIICCCVHPDLKNTHSQFPLPPKPSCCYPEKDLPSEGLYFERQRYSSELLCTQCSGWSTAFK